MKKLVKTLAAAAIIATGALLTSCATPVPLGCVYTNVKLPLGIGNGDITYNKIGHAKCISVLGWFASGDASIKAATMEGGIGRVSWATQEVNNILGIYGTYTTTVYGYGYDVLD